VRVNRTRDEQRLVRIKIAAFFRTIYRPLSCFYTLFWRGLYIVQKKAAIYTVGSVLLYIKYGSTEIRITRSVLLTLGGYTHIQTPYSAEAIVLTTHWFPTPWAVGEWAVAASDTSRRSSKLSGGLLCGTDRIADFHQCDAKSPINWCLIPSGLFYRYSGL
jgi:hypothetical protein